MKRCRLDQMVERLEGLKEPDREQIEKMQTEKLNRLLKKEHIRGGFYKDLPEMVETPGDLKEIPFTTAEDLRRYGSRMVLCSQSEIMRIITDQTSGTTGNPKRICYTQADLMQTIDLFEAGLGEFVFPGSVTLIAMPFSGPFGLGDLIAKAIVRLGAKPISCGPFLTFGEYRQILKDEKPDTFVGTPVFLLSLLRYLGPFSLKRALVSGDACPDSVMKGCEELLGSRLFPHYGSREMALGGAVTCSAHDGMHLRENHVIAEIVDKKGNPLPDGETGELVITTIGMEAQPLIRYRTGDEARLLPGICSCGSAYKRLEGIRRMGDYLMEQLDDQVLQCHGVIDWIIRESGNAYEADLLTDPKREKETAEAVRKKLELFLPGKSVFVRTRSCKDDCSALYRSKRTLVSSI